MSFDTRRQFTASTPITVINDPSATGAATLRFNQFTGSGNSFVGIKAADVMLPLDSYTLTLPAVPPLAGQLMVSDGIGNLSWNQFALPQLIDADLDTRITVENTVDEDTIRMFVGDNSGNFNSVVDAILTANTAGVTLQSVDAINPGIPVGPLNITGGSGDNGGDINVIAGQGTIGGGGVNIRSGIGGNTSGGINLITQTAITTTGGVGVITGDTSGPGGQSGSVILRTGNSDGNSGTILMEAGTSQAAAGGNIRLLSGRTNQSGLGPATPDSRIIIDETTNQGVAVTGTLAFKGLTLSTSVGFRAPATIAVDTIWTLPDADGVTGSILTTNGLGTLLWQAPSAATQIVDADFDTYVRVEQAPDEDNVRIAVGDNSGVYTPGEVFRASATTGVFVRSLDSPAATSAPINIGTGTGGIDSGNLFIRTGNASVDAGEIQILGGTSSTASGADVALIGGDGLFNGGYASVLGGSATTNRGGFVRLVAGSSTNGVGGDIEIVGGPSQNANGGDLFIKSGDGNITGAGSATDSRILIQRMTTNTVATTGILGFVDTTGTPANSVGFRAPDLVLAPVIWKLPAQDGAAGTLLSTNGSGDTSWVSPGAAGPQSVQTVLNSFTSGTTLATWYSHPDTITIPSAGKWLITFNAVVVASTDTGLSWVVTKLFDQTAAADVPNSECQIMRNDFPGLASGATHGNMSHTVTYTTVGPAVIELQITPLLVGGSLTYIGLDINSNVNGRSIITATRVT